MRVSTTNIIPITLARSKLGDLAESVKGGDYVVLTKDGSPKIALVDIAYLTRLEEDIEKTYQKTFIDPKFLPYTRKFTDHEITEWLKEDSFR